MSQSVEAALRQIEQTAELLRSSRSELDRLISSYTSSLVAIGRFHENITVIEMALRAEDVSTAELAALRRQELGE